MPGSWVGSTYLPAGATMTDDGTVVPSGWSYDPTNGVRPPGATPGATGDYGPDPSLWQKLGAVGQGVGTGLVNMLTLPARVSTGQVDPFSPEAVDGAVQIGMSLPAGGMLGAEEGALGATGGAMKVAPEASQAAAVPAEMSLEDVMAQMEAKLGKPKGSADPWADYYSGVGQDARDRIASLNPNGLPMDEASRMARAEAMGFDTSLPLYHGTKKAEGFNAFNDTEPDWGTFLTHDPEMANAYTGHLGEEPGSVMPLFARMQNTLAGNRSAFPSQTGAIQAARDAGHDSLIFANMQDAYGHGPSGALTSAQGDQYVIMDPSQIRSRFAVFDPARTHEADLMAAQGVGAPPPAATGQQQQGSQPVANPWDNDPIVQATPAAAPAAAPNGNPWDNDPITSAGDPATVDGARALTVHGGKPPVQPVAANADPSGQPDGAGDASAAVGQGLINGIPVVGPTVIDGLNRGVIAPLRSLLKGESYDQALKEAQGFNTATTAAHPTVEAAGEFASAGLSMAALPAEAVGAGAAPLWARAAGASAVGGTVGAADSAARGQEPIEGAAAGTLGGFLAPAAGATLGAAYRGVRSAMQPVAPELAGLSRIARGWLQRGVGDATAAEVAGARANLGPQGFAGELTPGLTDLTGSVADNLGPGKATVRDAYAARQAGTTDRVNTLFQDSLGPHDTTALQYSRGLLDQASDLGRQRAAMLTSAPPVDISSVVDGINAQMPRTAENSPQRKALIEALQMVQERAPPAPAAAPTSGWEIDHGAPDPVLGEPPQGAPGAGTNPDDAVNNWYSKPVPPKSGRPASARDVVRSLGGVRDTTGDLAASGVDEMGPSIGKLIQAPNSGKGVSADQAAEVLAQMGYFGADTEGAMANRNTSMLADALTNHPTYPQGPEGEAWNHYQNDLAEWEAWRSSVDGLPRYKTPAMPGRAPLDPQGAWPPAPGAAAAPPTTPTMRPVSDPTQLHGLKQAFDASIDYDAKGLQPANPLVRSKETGYSTFRGGIDQSLRDAIPGYGANQDATSSLMNQQRNVREGTMDLDRTQNPADYAAMVAALSPEEIAARQVGNREAFAKTLGTSGNDFLAAKNKLQGITADGQNEANAGWNLRNTGTLFGADKAEALNTGLSQEAAMKASAQRVVGGSPTGEKVQRAALTQPDVNGGMIGAAKDWMSNLYLDKPSTYLPFGKMWTGFRAGAHEAARSEAAPLLMRQGGDGDALLQALLEARARQAAIPNLPVTPLARALMGVGQGTRRVLQGP